MRRGHKVLVAAAKNAQECFHAPTIAEFRDAAGVAAGAYGFEQMQRPCCFSRFAVHDFVYQRGHRREATPRVPHLTSRRAA